jgi:hypothetical protein
MYGSPLSTDGFTPRLLCRNAKGSVAIQDCDADFNFRDLSVKVPCHQPLA